MSRPKKEPAAPIPPLPEAAMRTGARLRTRTGKTIFVDFVQERMANEPLVTWHYVESGKYTSRSLATACQLLRGAVAA